MEEYKGYIIEVMDNKDNEYPFKAFARGLNGIEQKGFSRQNAIDLVKNLIDFTIVKQDEE